PIPFETTFAGLYERAKEHNNQPPFDLPKRWIERKDRLDLSTPFNFLIKSTFLTRSALPLAPFSSFISFVPRISSTARSCGDLPANTWRTISLSPPNLLASQVSVSVSLTISKSS